MLILKNKQLLFLHCALTNVPLNKNSMLNRIEASSKLYLLVAVISFFIIGIGIYGIYELKKMNQGTREIYNDRVVPLEQLSIIRYSYAYHILSVAQEANMQYITYSEAENQIQEAQKTITVNWKKYNLTYLTPEEAVLVKQTAVLIAQSNKTIEKLKIVLNRKDSNTIKNIINHELNPSVNSVILKINQLINLQIRVGGEIYKTSSAAYKTALKEFIFLIVLTLLLVISFSFYLIGNIDLLIQNLKESYTRILKSEKKYRSIFENVQDVYYQANLEGIVLDVSPSVESHIGYRREELIGTHVSKVYYNPADREDGLKLLKEKGEFKEYELRFKSKSGQLLYVFLNARLILNSDGLPSHIDGSYRNITDNKRIKDELAERKEQLAMFIEHSPVSLAMFDTEMKYISTSRRWIDDHNIAGQEIIGKNRYEIEPGIPQHWKDVHQKCLKGAIEKKDEDLFIRSDGSTDWMRWETRPWHKVSGEIGGIIIFSEVITDRKKAADLFKSMFDNSPDIILIIDKDFKIESMNRAIPNGTVAKELIGIHLVDNLPLASQEITRTAIKKCFETGQNQEIEVELGFGNWSRSRFVPLFLDLEISKIMIISTDITQSRKDKEKLIQSEEKHRALIENISDTIILIDEKYEVTYQSPSFIRTAGFTMNQLEGKTVFEFLHPDDIQNCQDLFKNSYKYPNMPFPIQYRIRHKNGNYIWIEGTITNLFHDESVKALIVVYRDITRRKKAEQELINNNAELKKTNSELDRFVYSTSHDLRAPLKSMLGLIAMSKDITEPENTTQHELLSMLDKNVFKLDNFIEDILHYSRNSRLEIAKEEINFKNTLEEIKETFKAAIEEKKVSIQIGINAEEKFISDKKRIHIILNNIISNAIKYLDKSKDTSFVKIGIECNTEKVNISIEDNGIGIDNKDAEKIFEMFYRATTLSTGSGLGLYIVKETLEKLAGKITLESELTKGTKFNIEIPNQIN